MEQESPICFKDFFINMPFIDRIIKKPEDAVDVIIPVMHTNELWRNNLLSFYREIPVNRLLIGNAGCIDNSLKIAREFPRVEIFDHSDFVSLGYSIRKLIESVETEWFVYLHSDVYLPEGWFAAMKKGCDKYDWFECRQHVTILSDYPLNYTNVNRPLSGSQMGLKTAFKKILPTIDDDFLYRNEDIILANLIEREGYRYGRLDEAFHYHQVMNKRGPWLRKIKQVSIQVEPSREEEIRACITQAKGIIKYLKPSPDLANMAQANIDQLMTMKELDWTEFELWIKETNPIWMGYIKKGNKNKFRNRLDAFLSASYHLIFG